MLPGRAYTATAIDSKDILNTDASKSGHGHQKIGQLDEILVIKISARVMLNMNVDVSDGLCNSAIGTVSDVTFDRATTTTIKAVWVKFDNPIVGAHSRAVLSNSSYPSATRIIRSEVLITSSASGNLQTTRRQFPLCLAFATTIHKVQGLTLDSIVVSFGHFSPAGMYYVALSRTRAFNGLKLLSFNRAGIKASNDVKQEMKRLHNHKIPLPHLSFTYPSVGFLNARSLSMHIEDIRQDERLTQCTVLGICESWLKPQHLSEDFALSGYSLYRMDGSLHGGLAMYIKATEAFEVSFKSSVVQLLALTIGTGTAKWLFVIGHRPPSTPLSTFLAELQHILLTSSPKNIVVAADFNVDIAVNSNPVSTALLNIGMRPASLLPTVRSGKCIDCMFLSSADVSSGSFPVHFSDHCAIWSCLDFNESHDSS